MATLLSLAMLASCSRPTPQTNAEDMSQEALIKRGQYLTTVGSCHDCHTPKVFTETGIHLDSARLLSGHPSNEAIPPLPATADWISFSGGLTAFVGPWGISYSANLSPDDTGTGSWSFDQFKTAIRKGKYKGLEGSRDLLPPMPWEMYRHFTDEDLKAIFTYLQSIKPVSNLVPAPVAPQDMEIMMKTKK